MGCWNATDMVTHLPIQVGDKCSMVLLLESSYHQSQCYATNSYLPIFMVKGRYDDYGGLENIRAEKSMMKLFKNLPLYRMAEDGEYDPAETFTCFNDLLEAINDGLYVKQDRGVTKRGKSWLRLEAVCIKDSAIKMATKLAYGTPDEWSEDCADYVESAFVTARENHQKFMAYKKGLRKKTEEDMMVGMDLEWRMTDSIRNLYRMMNCSAPNVTATKFFCDCYTANQARMEKDFREMFALNQLLDDLRMSWHLPSGAGSQSTSDPAQDAFIKLYRKEKRKLEQEF